MNRSSLNVGLSNLKKWHEEKDALRYDLSFQRHTGMWSVVAKSMLVWSILSDSYIPPLVFLKCEEDVVDEKGKSMSAYSILDGAQRTSNLFSFIQQYTMAGMTAKVCKKLRSDFIEKLNRLPHSYFNTHLQGDILSCITNDIQTLRQGISRCLPNLTKSIAQFLTCLVMMIITE